VVPSRAGFAVSSACILLSSIVLAGSALVAPAQAADLNEIKSDQRQVQSSLASTNQALGKANTKLQKALSAATAAQRTLVEAKLEKKSAQREAKRANAVAESARIESEYAKSALVLGTRALTRLNRLLASQRGDIEDVARLIYQQGPLSEVGVLMSAQDPADFTARMVAVNYVSREQQSMERTILASSADATLQEVKLTALTEKASAAQSQTEREKAKALQALESAKEKQQVVIEMRNEKRQAVQTAKVFRGKIKNRYEQLKREQRKLEVMAKKAVAAAKKAAARASASQTSESPNGSLTWPLPGHEKGGGVGPRIHPIYGHSSCHTGIDIGAPSGTSAISADSGSVAAITRGGPYGNAVLVVHTGGLTTFYAHLSSVSVSLGDSVNAGQEVGKVGSTGWSTGPHLHFETRLNGTAYDPMGWFGQSMQAVPC
jgi:murein DD-endopeptidase MepM/ murein hydrolase activator NlpD